MLRKPFLIGLLLYVSLDFAAPLMPGAIYFDDGDLVVVAGDRARVDEPLQYLRPMLMTRPFGCAISPLVGSLPVVVIAAQPHPGPLPAKRPPRRLSDTPVSSPEDH